MLPNGHDEVGNQEKLTVTTHKLERELAFVAPTRMAALPASFVGDA